MKYRVGDIVKIIDEQNKESDDKLLIIKEVQDNYYVYDLELGIGSWWDEDELEFVMHPEEYIFSLFEKKENEREFTRSYRYPPFHK